jgi:thioester reductase-like protein
VRCDVCRDRLGLVSDAYREFARGADAIVHAAGETDWSAYVRGLERWAADKGWRAAEILPPR